jgi:hypothetical protein
MVLVRCSFRLVSPHKNTRSTRHRPVAAVPISIAPRFVSVFFLPLTTLGVISSHEPIREHFPATVIPMTAPLQLVRSGNEFQNVGIDWLLFTGRSRRSLSAHCGVSKDEDTLRVGHCYFTGSHICAVAHCTVPVQAGCHHSRCE